MANEGSRNASTLLACTSLQERVYKIRDKIRIYDKSCEQLNLVDDYISQTEIRLQRAQLNQNTIFEELLLAKLGVIGSVRYVFQKVAEKLSSEIQQYLDRFELDFGIGWSDIFEVESEEEDN